MVKGLFVEAVNNNILLVEIVAKRTLLCEFFFNYRGTKTILANMHVYESRSKFYEEKGQIRTEVLRQISRVEKVEVGEVITKHRHEYHIFFSSGCTIELSLVQGRLYLFYSDFDEVSEAKETTFDEVFDDLLRAFKDVKIIKTEEVVQHEA